MLFRGSIAPPARPLSTLRCALTGRQRMTRGQRDWLDLRCRALSSPAPCRFIPTLSPITHHVADPEPTRAECRSKPGRPRAHTSPTTRSRTPSRPRSAGIHADGRTPSHRQPPSRRSCQQHQALDRAAAGQVSSCLSLVFAVLDLFIAHASNGATFTELDRQHLYRIKYRQTDPDTIDEEVTAAVDWPREPQSRTEFTAVIRPRLSPFWWRVGVISAELVAEEHRRLPRTRG